MSTTYTSSTEYKSKAGDIEVMFADVMDDDSKKVSLHRFYLDFSILLTVILLLILDHSILLASLVLGKHNGRIVVILIIKIRLESDCLSLICNQILMLLWKCCIILAAFTFSFYWLFQCCYHTDCTKFFEKKMKWKSSIKLWVFLICSQNYDVFSYINYIDLIQIYFAIRYNASNSLISLNI